MIVVVQPHNAHAHSDLLDKMFKLRARVFHRELGWNVQVSGERERDKYDDLGPVYLIYTDRQGRDVKGSLRLLPTTGPTILTDFFSDTMPDAVNLSAPTIWECTRFCLDDQLLHRDRESFLFASTVLIIALGDLAMNTGIESIIGNFDAPMLRLYRRIGCEVEVLGSTRRYGRPIYLGLHPISETVVQRIRRKIKGSELAFAEAQVLAA